MSMPSRAGAEFEARADEKIDHAQRADHVVAAFELLVEHRQEAGKPGMGVGHDAGIEAWLIEHLRLDQHLPGERVDGCFRAADPPADPLVDQRLGFRIAAAAQPALRPLGREIFEDRGRLPQHEAILLQRRHPAIRIHGEEFAGARLPDARIDRHLVERDAKLGREQPHFARMRRGLEFVERDGHGVSSGP